MEALGSVTYTVQVSSTLHRCLKAVTLEEPLGAGKARRMHIPRTGWGEERPIAGVQLTVQPAVPSLL